MGRTECLCMSVQELGCGEKETQFLSVIVTSYWGVFTDPKVMKESFPSLLFLKLLREITLSGKESACQTGDTDSIPGWGRSPGGGNGNPLQYSCLENPMDRGAWWATVHGVTKSRIMTDQLSLTRGSWQEAELVQVYPCWCTSLHFPLLTRGPYV